uniref:Abhydro_lipase domain-containing protein n=1 Tax=Globodera pallida TaxID=36090 RepID=A0A183CPR8_GLOPA
MLIASGVTVFMFVCRRERHSGAKVRNVKNSSGGEGGGRWLCCCWCCDVLDLAEEDRPKFESGPIGETHLFFADANYAKAATTSPPGEKILRSSPTDRLAHPQSTLIRAHKHRPSTVDQIVQQMNFCTVPVLFILLFLVRASDGQSPLGPLTDHFLNWLVSNGYEGDAFDRPDIGPSGSYGGKLTAAQQITKEPVIFVHGTGDAALHTQAPQATVAPSNTSSSKR